MSESERLVYGRNPRHNNELPNSQLELKCSKFIVYLIKFWNANIHNTRTELEFTIDKYSILNPKNRNEHQR